MATLQERANEWIVGRDTGTSSQVIWSFMMGVKPRDESTPWDADDFGRCYRLLRLIPEWRVRMPELASKHKTWTALVREWDRLTAMYERVIAGKNGWDRAAAKAMFEAMDPLINEGRIADGWTQTGPGSWHKGSARTVQLGTGMSFSIK